MPAKGSVTYRFNDLMLDTGRRCLRRNGDEIKLGKLTYELLVLLVQLAPGVVMPEDMSERLWHGRFVSKNTIKQRIKLLRDALGDEAEAPRYIELVRGHGYRLLPPVQILESSEQMTPAHGVLRWGLGLIAVAASFAGVALYWLNDGHRDVVAPRVASAAAWSGEQSIAVLPFENLSSDSDDVSFVDGIHSDLLTQLAKIAGLKVISRTSVAQFAGTSRNLREIGAELGVATILEGSVQRLGGKVRVNAQLIDALTDEHLWADAYERELTAENLFAIQAEMAVSIARALHATLSVAERARLGQIPTRSATAYNYYLLGQSRLRRPDDKFYLQAAKDYERAVAEDPEFALAWAALGRTYSAIFYFFDRTDERRDKAHAAVERAFELDPELPEAHFARGFYLSNVSGDLEAALDEWERAEPGMRGNSQLYMARAYVYRRMAKMKEASASIASAIDLDPRNVEHLAVQAATLSQLHDYDQAELYADRIIEVAPSNPLGYLLKSQIPLWRDGDGRKLLSTIDAAPIDVKVTPFRWTANLYERDYEAALSVLDELQIETVYDRWIFRPRDWYFGIALDLAGQRDAAVSRYQAARAEAEQMLENEPEDVRVMIGLADVLGHLNEREPALALTRRALAGIPGSIPAPERDGAHLNAILALIAADDYDMAIAELGRFFSSPTSWSVKGLLRDPRFDPIREDPRVRRLVATHSAI